MVRKTVHRTENNYLLLQPAMLETRLQTPHDGTEDGAAPYAGDAGIALVAGKAGILHFSQAARLMGVSRQYIYKLVKEEKLRASRLSGKMSLIRKADIELMLKSKPYERLVAKNDFDITEYYTAEEIAQKYKVNAKWVWTYTRQHKVPKVRIRQFNYYSKKHIDAAFAKYEVDSDLTEWYTPEDIQEKYGMTRVAIRSHVYRNNIPSQKRTWADILLQTPLRSLEKLCGREQGRILHRQEAMEKFKLSRDSVYNILQFHQSAERRTGASSAS